jgi:hypothetical protein
MVDTVYQYSATMEGTRDLSVAVVLFQISGIIHVV